jgi:hypothetical protein
VLRRALPKLVPVSGIENGVDGCDLSPALPKFFGVGDNVVEAVSPNILHPLLIK